MTRHFNTAGPNFVLHAPRQSGKRTLLNAIVERLNGEGKYQALYVNVENAQVARNNVDRGIATIVELVGIQASLFLPKSWVASNFRNAVSGANAENALMVLLGQWANRASPSCS